MPFLLYSFRGQCILLCVHLLRVSAAVTHNSERNLYRCHNWQSVGSPGAVPKGVRGVAVLQLGGPEERTAGEPEAEQLEEATWSRPQK